MSTLGIGEKRQRWTSTVAFCVALLMAWASSDESTAAQSSARSPRRLRSTWRWAVSDVDAPTGAKIKRRGRTARLGEPPSRWRLAFMLMARRNLRTSTTRAFFFPTMKARRRVPSLRLPRKS